MPSADYTPEHACMATKIGRAWGTRHCNHQQTTVKLLGAVRYPLMALTDLYGQALAVTGIVLIKDRPLQIFRYLPPERWQHNLEHGVVVLLYHPCLNADPRGRKQLTRLIHTVRGCIRKHVVTPSRRWTT